MWMTGTIDLRSVLPGLALVAAIAGVARLLAFAGPPWLSETIVALVAGVLIANWFKWPSATGPGIEFAQHRLLRLAIILLGSQVSLHAIAGIGVTSIGLIILAMVAAIALTFSLAAIVGMRSQLTLLMAVGAAICGNTAILATAPVIAARGRDVTLAMVAVTLMGGISVIAYPLIGYALSLPDSVFGLWAGIAINDTSQVIAAAGAYSPRALEVATIVKLVRNALLGPLLIIVAWAHRRRSGHDSSQPAGSRHWVPLFVVGFALMSAIRTIGIVDDTGAAVLGTVARALILLGLAGVGLATRLDTVRGARPVVAVGLAVGGSVSVLALVSALIAHG
jgi:uncharacterized integral membrane protein (TIGR00698 family)